MNIAFRADASQPLGMGHVMRCLTIADTVKARGAKTRFVCRNLLESLRARIVESGHELVELPHSAVAPNGELPHSHLLGTTQEVDLHDSLRALSDRHWNWIVVDHYALDSRWETPVRGTTSECMAIDDLADRVHDTDVLLDQNIPLDGGRSRYEGKIPARCTPLLGPRYAVLREEFVQLRSVLRPRSGKIERLLIFFGGTDLDDYTTRALQAVAGSRIDKLMVDVVIGAEHRNRVEIERTCKERSFECHVNTSRMAELVARADVGLGASGSASWERCCLGLPAICVPTADNQIAVARGLANRGAVIVVDPSPSLVADLSKAIRVLARRPAALASMSVCAWELVDGRGTQRVCDELFRAA